MRQYYRVYVFVFMFSCLCFRVYVWAIPHSLVKETTARVENLERGIMTGKYLNFRYFVLLVRAIDDIPLACQQVSHFLEFQRWHFCAAHEGQRFIGVWIDAQMGNFSSGVFGGAGSSGHIRYRVRETIGLGGQWELCNLDIVLGSETADQRTIRESVISALVDQQPPHLSPSLRRFLPVFDAEEEGPCVDLQTNCLRRMFPDLIGEPLVWDRTRGTLAPISGNDANGSLH